MIELRGVTARARVRRRALAAQGLLHARPFGSGLHGARHAIRHLGYVQIDSIAVVQRAHHHVLYARVPGYEPAMMNRLLRGGDVFEYWAHAAAFMPMGDFRYSLPYKQAIRSGQVHWYKNPDTKLMREVLARIRVDGPLRSRDLEARKSTGSGWWDWKPAKKAIEQLYMRGDLMVADREGFQKTYDLTERVLPAGVDTSLPSVEALARYLLSQQLRSSAFVSLKGLTYLRRIPGLRTATKAVVAEKLGSRELEQVRLESGEVYLCEAGMLEQRLPRTAARVPEPKRRYGYFCLPLLYRDQFVGVMDCKAHRNSAQLELKSLHLQLRGLDESAFASAFAEALRRFLRFQGCRAVALGTTLPRRIGFAIKDMV